MAVAGPELETLRDRINHIMLAGDDPSQGIDCNQMLMMLEGGPQTGGWKGSTLNYRKIQGLECDSDYLAYLTSPLYRAVVEGPHVAAGFP